MKDNDIKKILPDWTLTYLLSEKDGEKIFQAEKESASGVKSSLIRTVFLPCSDENYEKLSEKFGGDENELRKHNARLLQKSKNEFAFLRRMTGKGGWLNLRESYDISNIEGTQSLLAARFDNAQSLEGFIEENGLTQGALLKMAIDVCRGLEKAKKAGRVHGSLSPDCIFVDENCKFRIGKIDSEISETKKITDTSTEALLFTAPWATQFGVNYTSDTYSVGLIMYYYLNNRKLPFEDTLSREDALVKRLSPKDIPKPANDIGRITEIVMKACQTSTKKRYQTPYQMRKDLEEVYVRLEKEIEEEKLRERAKQKQLENDGKGEEKTKDISAVREHQKDEDEIAVEKKESRKRKIISAAVAVIVAVIAVIYAYPKFANKPKDYDLSHYKVSLASSYYKKTDKAQEYEFDYEYDGNEKKPPIVIKGLEDLVEGKDYKTEYSDNIEVGKASVKVIGIGEYSGELTTSFNINPKKPTAIEKFETEKVGKDSVVLKWSESENANRYIIYKFHEVLNDWGEREYEVDSSERSITITGLESGTEYTFKIRGAFVNPENGDETKGEGTEITFRTES